MRIRHDGFVVFLFTRGTAPFSRGVSFAFSGVIFSLNPRGFVFSFRVRDKWHSPLNRVWWRVAP